MSSPNIRSQVQTRLLQALSLKERKYSKSFWTRMRSPEIWGWILNPLIQAGLWIAIAFWGAFASLWSSKITDVVAPWSPVASNEINPYTMSFTGSGVLLALGFALSKWVARYQDAIIVNSTLTMPPHGFWDAFGHKFIELAGRYRG